MLFSLILLKQGPKRKMVTCSIAGSERRPNTDRSHGPANLGWSPRLRHGELSISYLLKLYTAILHRPLNVLTSAFVERTSVIIIKPNSCVCCFPSPGPFGNSAPEAPTTTWKSTATTVQRLLSPNASQPTGSRSSASLVGEDEFVIQPQTQ